MKTPPFKYLVVPLLVTLLLAGVAGCGLVRSLGKKPDGDALVRMEALPNYKNGEFQNLNATGDSNKVKRSNRLLAMFSRPQNIKPLRQLPWVKINLKALGFPRPTVVWFGHSSLLIKSNQGNILIDPIFSDNAGPVPGLVKAFKGSTHYKASDMPPIDVLIISHDHYDHLDYKTVKKLRRSIKMVVVPMGVGSHFVYWGFDPKKITELNWGQSVVLPGGIKITATPAQHRSNRTFIENKTLWASYVIDAGNYRMFYSGDGGYGTHFKQIGQQYGPFDLALMECGQYSTKWSYTHMKPSQTAQAAVDLQARVLQPIHWAKFAESDHPWNEPVNLLLPAARKLRIEVSIPRIGEPYTLCEPAKRMVWWAFE
jgi:L-ascorbate metabolism protein UlaG (beta-lactamase superfamily)